MSDPITNKPDLDDTTNVNADAAAAQRENHMFTEGAEPLSLWIILGSAIVVLIGGGVLFGGGVFDYENFVKKDYVRAKPDDGGAGGLAPKPALDAYLRVGKKVYDSCSGCHQSDGQGNAAYPPLAGSEWVTGPSLKPAMIILAGLHEPITVKGKQYNGNMPPMGSGMDAKQLAGVLNYIRNSFGNSSENIITTEMAEDALALLKEREAAGGGQVTAPELQEKYARDLKGEPLPKDTMVDPKTLQPVSE